MRTVHIVDCFDDTDPTPSDILLPEGVTLSERVVQRNYQMCQRAMGIDNIRFFIHKASEANFHLNPEEGDLVLLTGSLAPLPSERDWVHNLQKALASLLTKSTY